MRKINPCILSLNLMVLASLRSQAQVYSQGIYSGGTCYYNLVSLDFPFPPYHYKATERSRYEDTNGLVIINTGHELELGGIQCRYIDIECGSNAFTVALDREPPRRARELEAWWAEQARHQKELLESGKYQVKTYVMKYRIPPADYQELLTALSDRETFTDGECGRATGPEPNLLRITASTNDLVIWDRVVQEFDQPFDPPPTNNPVTQVARPAVTPTQNSPLKTQN